MPLALIVDDDDEIREVLKTALESEGFSTDEASDGDTAIDIINSRKVAICILDIVMPRKGGIETLLDVRKEHPEMKIVFITGKISTETPAFRHLQSQFHVDTVFTKPIDLAAFVEKIREITGN